MNNLSPSPASFLYKVNPEMETLQLWSELAQSPSQTYRPAPDAEYPRSMENNEDSREFSCMINSKLLLLQQIQMKLDSNTRRQRYTLID